MTSMILPVTLTTAALAAFLNLWLALRIGSIRRAARISIGDGGNARLAARMRAQLNFAEYAPIVLILLALTELARGASAGLWIAGIGFIIARIAHAIGMDGVMAARGFGIIVTLAVMIGLAGYALVILFVPGTPTLAIELPPAMG